MLNLIRLGAQQQKTTNEPGLSPRWRLPGAAQLG